MEANVMYSHKIAHLKQENYVAELPKQTADAYRIKYVDQHLRMGAYAMDSHILALF